MKKRILFTAFFICSLSLQALDTGLSIGVSNAFFDDARTYDQSNFDGSNFGFDFSLYYSEPLNEQFVLDLKLQTDPVLRNRLLTELTFSFNTITMTFGPFFGAFNSWNEILKPGILLSLRWDIPGIAFFSARSETSLSGNLLQNQDYTQELSALQMGFYVPNAICTFNLHEKSFSQLTDGITKKLSVTDYFLRTDIFRKNTPYHLILDFIYRIQNMSFISDTISSQHSMHALVIGSTLDFSFGSFCNLVIELESHLFSFPISDLNSLNLADPGYLFNLTTGIVFHL